MAEKPTARAVWAATLGKLVAPMEPERASKAIVGLVAVLRLPDAAFTMESAMHVAEEGGYGEGGSTGPLKRVPTFGELQTCLGRWWRQRAGMERLKAEVQTDPAALARLSELRADPDRYTRLPAPEEPLPRDEHAEEHVREIVEQFKRERSWNQPSGCLNVRTPLKPLPLSDARLMAEYEKAAKGTDDFARLAATRLAMMRAKPGARHVGGGAD